MNVYLDTNLVSAIARDDHPGESEALAALLRKRHEGKVRMVTSKVTGVEIERCSGQHRGDIQRVYDEMKKVAYVEPETHVGYNSYWDDEMGGWSDPLYDVNPIWQSLREIGLDQTDAHHVMLAIQSGCDVFLTCDAKTILRYRTEIESRYAIRLMRPTECVAALEANYARL